jgi:ATP-dependent DNA ligase
MLQRSLPAGFIAPCLPSKTNKLPSGRQWRKDSAYRSGRSPDWLKMKNADAPAVKREAEEDFFCRPGRLSAGDGRACSILLRG